MASISGERIFQHRALACKALLLTLETLEQEPQAFNPYSRKYDAYWRGTATLSPLALRGLSVFNDSQRGNCARGHASARRGVPRNPAILANGNS